MKLEPLQASYSYHFFNRGNNKENVFIEAANYFYFLKLIKKYLIPIADVYSYCLLPNHFHLLLRIKDKELLPIKIKEGQTELFRPFSNLFNAYTKAFNKRYNRVGSLFQKHPKRIRVQNETYLRNLIIYINTNPSHHDISDFLNYKFSSYTALISRKPTLLYRDEVIALFNDVANLEYNHLQKKINTELIKDLLLE